MSLRKRLSGNAAVLLATYRASAADLDSVGVSRLDAEMLGEHGTIIYIPNCDRATVKQAKNLFEHAAREMSRVYRLGRRRYLTEVLARQVSPALLAAARTSFAFASESCSALHFAATDV